MSTTPQNPSGINPTEYKILVLPSKVEEKTKGGIILPDDSKDNKQHAQQEGTLIAASPLAFTYDNWNDQKPPQIGDRVLFAKYAGAVVVGWKDGVSYRLINDKDLTAVLA